MSKHVQLAGKTAEGNLVISGVWFLKDTMGLSLDTVFDIFMERGMLYPDWKDLFTDALNSGVNISKFRTELESCTMSTYGRDVWNAVSLYYDYFVEIYNEKKEMQGM